MGVVFAGTPHRGSEKARWAKVATNLAKFVLKDNSTAQVTALCKGSETLERLQMDFARVSGSLRIYTFCEEHQYSEAVGKVLVFKSLLRIKYTNPARLLIMIRQHLDTIMRT
jgi:hypothetical protein